jgi:hypothetical protein
MEANAPGTPAIATEQVGGDSAFIEKDVLPHVAKRQPRPPAAPVRDDVRPSLLLGVDGFF